MRGVGGGSKVARMSRPGMGIGIPGSSTLPQQEDDFHGLSFYEYPPQGETSMQEISDACLRRLHVLQNMDQRMGVDFNIYQLGKFSSEYDALLDELSQTGDLAKRGEIGIKLNNMLTKDSYTIVPLVHRGRVSAHAKSLGGVVLNTWDSELWNVADWYRIK